MTCNYCFIDESFTRVAETHTPLALMRPDHALCTGRLVYAVVTR